MTVIDTCSIIWDALSPSYLSQKAKSAINKHEQEGLIFCDISAWEIAMLIKKGKLQVDETPSNLIKAIIDSRNYFYKSITPEIADLSANLANEINKDPADRSIVATSIIENVALVTADKNLIESNLVRTIW